MLALDPVVKEKLQANATSHQTFVNSNKTLAKIYALQINADVSRIGHEDLKPVKVTLFKQI